MAKKVNWVAISRNIFFTPDVPSAKSWRIRHFTSSVFRGISQVAFVENPLGGLLILIGCAIASLPGAVLGFLSVCICTLVSYAVMPETRSISHGLHGYNGFLVGLALPYFDYGFQYCSSEACRWGEVWKLIIPCIVASVLCSIVHISILRSPIPPLTFAYNISVSMWLAFAQSLGPLSPYATIFSSAQEVMIPIPMRPSQFSDGSFTWFMQGSLAGLGQVFFSPTVVPSVLILLGLCIGSPISAVLGWAGSTLGFAVAWMYHSDLGDMVIGLDGLSASLAAIACGAFYFPLSRQSLALALLACLVCVAARHAFAGLLVHPVGPAMTLPFCVVTAFFVNYGRLTRRPSPTPTPLLSSAERHWAIWNGYLYGEQPDESTKDVEATEAGNSDASPRRDEHLIRVAAEWRRTGALAASARVHAERLEEEDMRH